MEEKQRRDRRFRTMNKEFSKRDMMRVRITVQQAVCRISTVRVIQGRGGGVCARRGDG